MTFTGPVFAPGDEGFDQERTGYSTLAPHEPALVVGAADAEDVRRAVAYAAERGLPVAVQATGHSPVAAAPGCVLVSTGRMSGVRVDPVARTARVEAGARWRHVLNECCPLGLAPLSGSTPGVGVAGYTLGGGLPLLGREFGWAADHVRSIDLVTADGVARTVTAASDPELFWGLRGGRDNFGVVTALEIGLFPVERFYGGGLYFPGERARDVLEAYRAWTATVPEAMSSSVALIPLPDVPALPEAIRGRYVAHVRIVYNGAAAAGERLIAPLRAIGPRLVDSVGMLPYANNQVVFNDPPQPADFVASNVLLREFGDTTAEAVADQPAVIEIRQLGGALSREPEVPNAIGHRDAAFMLCVLSPMPSVDDPIALRNGIFDAVEPLKAGRALNFLFDDASAANVRAAYDEKSYERLRELKAAYDPGNRFRANLNIPVERLAAESDQP